MSTTFRNVVKSHFRKHHRSTRARRRLLTRAIGAVPVVEQLENRRLLSAVLYRVNAGGAAVGDWTEDSLNNPSIYGNAEEAAVKLYSTTSSIDLSDPSVPIGTPMEIFQTHRFDRGGATMQYHFPVAAGQYQVRLYFAEINPDDSAVGERAFNVFIEGQKMLSAYDTYADVGANKGVVKTFTVTSDTSLDLDFKRVSGNPMVAAIEIVDPNASVTQPNTLGLSTNSINFGNVVENTSAPTQSVTLTNLGGAGDPDITITSISLSGSDASLFTENGDPVVLAPGQSITVDLGFNPTSTGARSATLNILHSGVNSPDTVTLSGYGIAAPTNQAPVVNAGEDQTISLPNAANLSGSASDDGLPGATLTTTWSFIDGPGDVNFGDASQLNTTATFSIDGTYTLRLTASDGELFTTDDITITVNPAPQPGSYLYRVNAAGETVETFSGDTDAAPSPYLNSVDGAVKIATTTAPIDLSHPSIPAGTPMAIFQTQRFDRGGSPMQWDFPVTPGQYQVRLYFAEISSGQMEVGARYFDVTIEGQLVLDDYDIYAEVGGNKAIVKTFTITADSNIDIDFKRLKNNPTIAAVEIIDANAPVTQPNVLGVSTNAITFPSTVVGASAPTQSVTLTNLGGTGDPAITISSVSLTGDHPSLFSENGDPVVLAPGQSITIDVGFTPDSVGPKSATLAIVHSGSNSPAQITLSGGGIAAPINQAPVVNAGDDQTVTLPNSASLSGSASDDGLPIGGTFTTTWGFVSGPGIVTFGDESLLNTTASFSEPGTYVLSLTASDGALTSVDEITIQVNPEPPPGTFLYRVNAAGSAVETFSGDTNDDPSPYLNVVAGDVKANTTSATIDMTHPSIPAGTPMAIFQTHRFDRGGTPMQWDFPVTPGQYEVRLYFAETSPNQMVVGGRYFDVTIEGQLVLDDYDIYAEVGGNRGVVKSFVVTSDANLDIDFKRLQNNPLISAVEIIPANPTGPSTLGASVSSLNFGDVVIGSPVTRTVTLTNTAPVGGQPITLNGTHISGPHEGSFTDDYNESSPVTLQPGQSIIITVTLNPLDEGTKTSTLSIGHTGSNTPLTISLTGNAVTEAPSNQAPIVNAGDDQIITLPSNVSLSGSVSDDGLPTGSTLTVTWSKFSGPGDVIFGTPNSPISTASFSTSGTYVLHLTATDGDLTTTDAIQIIVNPAPVSSGILYRVNAGGNLIDSDPDWTADTSSNPSVYGNAADAGSKTSSTGSTIDMTHPSLPAGTPAAIFASQRWDGGGTPMRYAFPVAPGQYEVRFYFAETSPSQQAIGARIFSVQVEGSTVLSNHDVYAEVGANKGIMKSFLVNSDGTLDISFIKQTQNPMVQAIEIVSVSTTPTLSASHPSLTFGNVNIGENGTRQVTLTHTGATGSGNIVIDSTSIFGTHASLFSDDFNDAANVTLAPGESTIITVSFSPDSEGGKSATLRITHDGSNSPIDISLAGTGQSETNAAPTVNAGGDLSVSLAAGATLNGSASDDGLPDGTLITTWTKFSGPGDVTFGDASSLITTATFSQTGTYVLRLTADDGALTTFDDIIVNVSDTISPVGFGKSTLTGLPADFNAPTSLQFGPDGRLYIGLQKGGIAAVTIERTGPNSYHATNVEIINLIKEMPNRNDRGEIVPGVNGRLILGILVTGTGSNPVIYVSHSDPRITGGGDNGDLDLDTNSGIISRLKWNGSAWEKLDIVRGLPRSEENHATNGLSIDKINNILYVGQGGNTNAGAPSHDLAFLPEYALSAAVLSIDLNMIGETTYDLPTLDDFSRPNTSGTTDINDPFGGNDGHNQAVIVPGGPVQVYASGFRNPYDVVVTRSGRIYTIDNGPNAGWGGKPVDSNGNPTTPETAGDATNNVVEGGKTFQDNLHLLSPGFYGGHPSPTRANNNNTFNGAYPFPEIYSGNSPVPFPNPIEGYYLEPGEDGSLTTFSSSTNGLTEYTALNFGGQMDGDLLAVSFDNKLYRIKLSPDGISVVSKTVLASNVGSIPLDVTAQGQLGPFPGTIWVADLPGDAIIIFEPNDYDGNPGGGTGAYDPTLDEDFDGYNNADEIDNGTSPLSAGDIPSDWDHDFLSDLNDPNDDNDLILDVSDPFALDAFNGRQNNLPISYQWENEGDPAGGILNLGWRGLMTNGVNTWKELYDEAKMTAGGAAGVMTLDEISEGTAWGNANTQEYGFQFGINVTPTSPVFYAHTRLLAPYAGFTPEAGMEIGLQVGTGDQDNYVKLIIGGEGQVKFAKEINGNPQWTGSEPVSLNVDAIDLYIIVDPANNTARAVFRTIKNGAVSEPVVVGALESIPAAWFNLATGMAVGVISTSAGASAPFAATWDMIEAVPVVPNTLAVSSTIAAYGAQLNGQSYTRTVTLTNLGAPGDPDIIIDGTTITGISASEFSDSFLDGGTTILAPGESLEIDITFSPTTPGDKSAQLNISNSSSTSPIVINLSAVSVINGLLGEYYNNIDLTDFVSSRIDPNIDFQDSDFGSAPPGTGVTADDKYSERWTGYVYVETPGDWTFTTRSNDGVRLWVNGTQLVDHWNNHSAADDSGTLNFAAPGWYPITLEHYNDTGSTVIELNFQGPGRSKQIIPTTHLGTSGSPTSNANRLGVSLASVNFGNVFTGQNSVIQVTLTNLGSAGNPNITIDLTNIIGAQAAAFSDSFNDATNVVLTPGQSTVINVTFAPSVEGLHNAVLQIVHSGTNTPLSVNLSGTGVSTVNGFWTAGANMPVKLGETASGHINGKIYVVGDGSNKTLAYDIATNTWVDNLAVRPQVGKDHLPIVINGKLYLFGGVANIGGSKTALDIVQIYDPVTDEWTTGEDMPFPTFAAASAIINGEVYLAGGVGSNIQTQNVLQKYNPVTDQWTVLASMPHGRDSGAAGTDGSKLYIFGGRTGGDAVSNGFNTVQIYDPVTNTWISSLDNSGPGANLEPLPQARGGMVHAPFYNGEFYVIGGETSTGAGANDEGVYDRVDIYNPITNTWRLGAPMPTARHGFTAVLIDGKIYIAGGGISNGKSQSSILEIYNLP